MFVLLQIKHQKLASGLPVRTCNYRRSEYRSHSEKRQDMTRKLLLNQIIGQTKINLDQQQDDKNQSEVAAVFI